MNWNLGEKEAVAWALEFFLDVTYDDMRDPEESGIDGVKFRRVANFYYAMTGKWRLNGSNVEERPWYMEKVKNNEESTNSESEARATR